MSLNSKSLSQNINLSGIKSFLCLLFSHCMTQLCFFVFFFFFLQQDHIQFILNENSMGLTPQGNVSLLFRSSWQVHVGPENRKHWLRYLAYQQTVTSVLCTVSYSPEKRSAPLSSEKKKKKKKKQAAQGISAVALSILICPLSQSRHNSVTEFAEVGRGPNVS